jgi:hypothetical protein
MTHPELTAHRGAATSSRLTGEGQAKMQRQSTGRRRAMFAGAAIFSASAGGCINIAAPDEPIVIELNINIRQEVIFRLAEDAANTIEENADIF